MEIYRIYNWTIERYLCSVYHASNRIQKGYDSKIFTSKVTVGVCTKTTGASWDWKRNTSDTINGTFDSTIYRNLPVQYPVQVNTTNSNASSFLWKRNKKHEGVRYLSGHVAHFHAESLHYHAPPLHLSSPVVFLGVDPRSQDRCTSCQGSPPLVDIHNYHGIYIPISGCTNRRETAFIICRLLLCLNLVRD